MSTWKVVETSRTSIVGREENQQEPQEMDMFEEKAEEEAAANSGWREEDIGSKLKMVGI